MDTPRLQALKAAAYDTLVQIEQLQTRLRQLNGMIAEEARAAPPGNGAPAAPAMEPAAL